jgi:S-adenosylmethionine/arginine decarboxylase-like enzyme
MKQYKEPIIERLGSGKLKGNSALQFIQTSSITIHTDEHLNRVFIDIFSCKEFDKNKAKIFSKNFFSAKKSNSKSLNRF